MNEQELKERITDAIRELGIPTNYSGYYYIRTAIMLVQNDITATKSMMKNLYPRIAKEHKVTVSKVERAIRHAIQTGYNRKPDSFSATFGENNKPTNSGFITLLADNMLYKRR